jgi:hypothetical protein
MNITDQLVVISVIPAMLYFDQPKTTLISLYLYCKNKYDFGYREIKLLMLLPHKGTIPTLSIRSQLF